MISRHGGWIVAASMFVAVGGAPAHAQDSYADARVDAVKTFAAAAAAGDAAALTQAYVPLAWGLEMMASMGAPVTDDQKAGIQQQYEADRDKSVQACIAALRGKTITTAEDRGTSRFSENELKEMSQMEQAGLNTGTGDVMVSDGTTTHHFRVFQYQDDWYFVDCR